MKWIVALLFVLSSCSRQKSGARDAVRTSGKEGRSEPSLPLPPIDASSAEIVDSCQLFDARTASTADLVDASNVSFAMPSTTGPFEWKEVLGAHWQISSPPGEPSAVTDAREGTRGACAEGMVEIKGSMKNASSMDQRQQDICSKWISRKFPERCAAFDRDKWLAASRSFPKRKMHYCIDRFEYPNRRGEFPVILVNWVEAKGICEADHKRLCTESEWTFACEGEEATPYPYGYVREEEACIVDRPWIPFNPYALGARSKETIKKELARLWQGEASGSRPRCKSVFGVYDMIGNIDEWTQATTPGRPSILKGGYWGPVRTRCRPTTRAHGEMHVFYQQGFRCCTNSP